MKQINNHKVIVLALWALAILTFIGWLVFRNSHQEEVCKDIQVKIYPSEEIYFVTRSRVIQLLNDSLNQSAIGKPLTSIDLNYLERKLNKNPNVERANVYTHLNGKLVAEVWQKEPIIRIQKDNDYAFYIDRKGESFPTSINYTARVMVATGRIDSTVVKKLYTLALFVQENAFWKAQIEQIFVTEQKDIILIPKIGNCELVLGDIDRLEQKLNDLQVFMQKGFTTIGWQKYKSVSVKFKDILVCK
jgi:cell division protein FtsQ